MRVSIVYLQMKFNEIQNENLTQIVVFLEGIEVKSKFLLQKVNQVIYFKSAWLWIEQCDEQLNLQILLLYCCRFWLQCVQQFKL